MYPELLSLLQTATAFGSYHIIVVTSGIKRIWENVIQKEGLSKSVHVIGGGRLSDGFVVTPSVKAALVTSLREQYKKTVWTFGDSVVDIEMLNVAHEAIVVVGDLRSRSKSMDQALSNAIRNEGLKARQVLLPKTVEARLDSMRLPVVDITTQTFSQELFGSRTVLNISPVIDLTGTTASKLLATPMRDAKNSGRALRRSHQMAGWYLATEKLSSVTGLEEYQILHPKKLPTTGYRFRHEDKITIVALIRGGEPMATGISDALHRSMFLHAKMSDDIKQHHLEGQAAIVLVDSVINSGSTMQKFVERVRSLHATIRIILIAGVVQSEVVSGHKFDAFPNLQLITLRISENKYVGVGSSDTGNRLFNTTRLD